MSKKTYELTISSDYVHNWTIEDAIREIMQNAIDSQTDGHPLSVDYSNGTLTITNIGCSLAINTLVLGSTGKHDPNKYIGTYGEGFKLALIVLLRNERAVTIYTNKQMWQPEFRLSKKFKIETLHIDITEANSIDDVITFKIDGIDYELFNKIRSNSLAMSKAMGYGIGKVIETEYGDILLEPRYKGKMFVNGLFVQTDTTFNYGYDFKPEFLHLDRDRRAISYYKARELTAKAITAQGDVNLVYNSIVKSHIDVKDVCDHIDSISNEFKVNFAQEFIKTHELDEDTFVGLEKEVIIAKKEKAYVTDSKAIAELVNAGLGKEDEYSEIKKKVSKLTNDEEAREYYETSDFKLVVDYLYNHRHFLEVESILALLENVTELYPSYFRLIKDEVFSKFTEEDEDNETEE